MADEISQVVEMEYKGVYYLFKGTKAMIAAIAKTIKALADRHHNKYLNMPGNCDWNKMQEISKGIPPILEFPKEMFEKKVVGVDNDGLQIKKSDFDLYCEKYDLRYCIMPDLNPTDDYIPIAVPVQDVGIHKEQIKAVMERRISMEEDKGAALDKKIAQVKEKIENATTDIEKNKYEEELAMLIDAKTQNEELLKESKDKMEHENEIDFADYIKSGKGSLFETDPEKALEQDEACGIVKEYTPYECMWPIRDEDHVPESGELFYSQTTSDDKIHTIKREFKRDDHGNIFSEYRVRMPGTSETMVYSDYGLSKEQWKKQIPEMLKKAGLVNGEMTAVVPSEERFRKYRDYLESNFNKASKEESLEANYSSSEAEAFVKSSNEKVIDKAEYEDAAKTVYSIPVSKVMPDEEEILCMEVEEGLIKGIEIDSMTDKEANVVIRDDKAYKIVKPDGNEQDIRGIEIRANMSSAVSEATSKVAGKGR